MVGMKGLAPQGCQILSLDPLLFGLNHMPMNWCIRQDGLPKPYQLVSPNGLVRYREPCPTCKPSVRSGG
jgi:hypothetical protein